VWPADGAVTDDLRARLHAYTEKAIREAAVHTTWNDPDTAFETAAHAWLDAVMDGPIAAELTSLVAQVDKHARNDALGQKLIALTAPGVPDVYQGTELWEDSLVDPDNRRPVDYQAGRQALAAKGHPKMTVTESALQLRRRRSTTFIAGRYTPLFAKGPTREHIVSFGRGDDVVVAVSRWTLKLAEKGWGGTLLALPQGRWRDCITGQQWSDSVPAEDLFATMPVAMLERLDD
jgi:(1->4)-alpha-D-glucan 1-alpha-D-glucosylmutase